MTMQAQPGPNAAAHSVSALHARQPLSPELQNEPPVTFWKQLQPSVPLQEMKLPPQELAPAAQVPGPAQTPSWQVSPSRQTTAVPAVQVPSWQVSFWVQPSPSSQAAPLALAGLEQAPVAGLQVPSAWHWSGGAQTTG